MVHQPFLHDLHVAVAAPVQAWLAPDGQVHGDGAQGWYVADTRAVAAAVVRVGGDLPESIAVHADGPGRTVASFVARALDSGHADPTVRLDRHVTATTTGVAERYVLSCATDRPVATRVEITVAPDATGMDAIRSGGPRAASPAAAVSDGTATWQLRPGVPVRLHAPGADLSAHDGTLVAAWDLVAEPGRPAQVGLSVELADPGAAVGPPARADAEWSRPEVSADDARLGRWLGTALDDLAGLRMTAPFAPDDVFLAAGAPWFFTLFGRDSLWAARMLLPLGTDLAAGTLRTLAARQGDRVDPASAQQPGKILHEVRRTDLQLADGSTHLPPLYYGTVDATALWVVLLHDAWRWGMAAAEVAALLDPLEAALGWMVGYGDPDGDGFLEYVDDSGHGLANQGWKDSGDSVQWRDGGLADPPIALVEVQGYAYEAAVKGAALLDAFGRPGADRWRAWAAGLATRFRSAFWVDDPRGAYPGIGLDGDKRLVDSLTSNIGHLLGTGLLNPEEERAVADRLAGDDLTGERGLRTLATGSAGYWPLRYHGGAIWPHDTAITIAGLAASGHGAPAAALTHGLLAASVEFSGRLPELWSGEDGPRAVPYPAACRPQAWSAAAAVGVLGSALGLRPDVPGGRLDVAPPSSAPLGALDVRGLRLAGRSLDVRVSGGRAQVRTEAPVQVHGATRL